MHYYKFNIPDWNLATSHLTLEEEAIYFRLINYYYDTEQPIPAETQSVIRRLRLGSHSDTVGFILSEFFTLTEKGWCHFRCDDLIEEYQSKADNNRKNGIKGGRPKKNNNLDNNPEETQSVSKNNPNITLTINHKPITNNQEPLIINTRKSRSNSSKTVLEEFGISGQLAEDFIRQRKKPITKTAVEGMIKESKLAGILLEDAIRIAVERGWESFKADWILKVQSQSQGRKYGIQSDAISGFLGEV